MRDYKTCCLLHTQNFDIAICGCPVLPKDDCRSCEFFRVYVKTFQKSLSIYQSMLEDTQVNEPKKD